MRRGRDLLDRDLGRRLRDGHVARLRRGVALGLRAHHAAVVEADCARPGPRPLAVMGHVISILLGRGEGRNQHTAGEGRGVRIRTGSGRKSQN